ncbi:hypothetical protein MTP99_012935 [Tenebrio molitor]|nr:hypothetical protein MTP99_012935 [Tenebrio molitor]
MYMLLDCINYLTAEYEDEDDVSLLKSDEYQKVIKERLRFFVIRHIELKRLAQLASDLAAQCIPLLSIGGVLMCLSAMSFVYLGDFFGYYCYFQNFMWYLCSVSTAIIFIKGGQNFEDVTSTLFPAIYETRWTTFNKNNRKTMLLILMNCQEPLKLQFTNTVSCNYELGVQGVKILYSFGATMTRLSEYTSSSNK